MVTKNSIGAPLPIEALARSAGRTKANNGGDCQENRARAHAGGQDFRGIVRPVEPNLEEGYPLYAVVSAKNRAAAADALPDHALVSTIGEALDKICRAGPWALR